MMPLHFSRAADSRFRVLCLGAHSDDIEIGCGGTILRLIEENPHLEVCWAVLGAAGPRKNEAVESANFFLAGAGQKQIITRDFRDGFFPHLWAEIKEFFEELKSVTQPDLIFTHYRKDLHQDHRLVSELAWNTFRNHLILEYEIVKYDGDLGAPNVFVPLSKSLVSKKIEMLMRVFQSQRNKSWFTEDTFNSILRLRGVESNAPEKHAEAFYGRKMVL